jgi:citronellol/citronellal dehydrogenase
VGYNSIFRPGLFDGQVVIVTGGGSGIGRCTAHELASLGATVALAGRDVAKLESVRAEIETARGVASPHGCDIRVEAEVIALIDGVLAQHGRLDALVNNAGGQYPQPLAQISSKGFEAVVRLNLFGGFMMMREAYNRWMADNGGSIVNIIADIWHGWPNFAYSGAARGGMWTLSESAASEWAPAGVRVNCVAPGGIASSGFDTYAPEDQEVVLRFPTTIPMQRYGNVAEVSAAIVYCSPRPLRSSPVAAFGWTAEHPMPATAGTRRRRTRSPCPSRGSRWNRCPSCLPRASRVPPHALDHLTQLGKQLKVGLACAP